MIRETLEGQYRSGSWNSNLWSHAFWQQVTSQHEAVNFHPALVGLLQGHGWVGMTTSAPPRTDQLIKELRSFESSAAPSAGASAAVFRAMPNGSAEADIEQGLQSDDIKWHNSLPPDLSRAAGEIYVSIRSSGSSSIRDYVDRLFASPEARASQKFQELFAKATNENERLRILNTSDILEIYLRNLGAYVHHRRTGDADAANHMLAVRAPGGDIDITPSWLVSSGTLHSKAEFQRKERSGGARSSGGLKKPEGEAKAKGGDKGKGGATANANG